jgi:putative addiction module component (TIGR02574 family)
LIHHLCIIMFNVWDEAMETAQLESITNAAMTLPEKQRAKLAHDLMASLDGPADISVTEAWDAEICRRINDIQSGKAELLDADEAIARARAKIRG